MIKLLTLAAAIAVSAPPVIAQDCSAATQKEFRSINDTLDDQTRTLRKLKARVDGQQFRLIDLSEERQATVPSAPEAPVLAATAFDTEDFVCDQDGNAADDIARALINLSASDAALAAFETAIQVREDALTAAESDPAADETPDQAPADIAAPEDTPPVPDSDDGDTEAPDVADADAVAPDAATVQMPMQDLENEALFRRVISLPDTILLSEPVAAEDGTPVSIFSVLYVYDDNAGGGTDWLQVGDQLRDGPLGWIRADNALPWSSMLVMQFTPRGQRERVLFFKDSTPLSDIVNSPFFTNEAREIYAEIEREQTRLQSEPNDTPNWNSDLVAIEPETAVTFSNEPYLLPILDWREELFDGLTETTLLQVAAIPAEAEEVGETDTTSFTNNAAAAAAAADGEFRVGIVFVMDTTISMAPFIERTKQVVSEFYDAFGDFETSAFVSFGLVGFRDNIANNADGLEYLTEIFQPLDPQAPPQQLLANLDQVREATAPTLDFKEDVYAGVADAINEMDWSPYDARIIILVTDASARTGDDPLLRDQGTTADTVAAMARASNVTIIPLHLLTDVNRDNNDIAIAETQFRTLGETGDIGADKYVPLNATSDEQFSAQLKIASRDIASAILTVYSGDVLSQIEFEPIPDMDGATAGDDRLGKIIQNEIFRAQLESLAQVGGGDAPAFLAGWASDRDMIDPGRRTLEVSVFLTRNQLSTLDKQLDSIVGAFRSGGDDPQAFFDNLQVLAAEMSTDPDAVRADDRLAVQTLLPTFIQNLPYKSEVLRLDRDYWSSLSNSLREEFIENIEAKQRIYQDTFNQTDVWRDFGSDDPGLESTLMLLKHLP